MPQYPSEDPGLNIGAQRRLPDFDYADPAAICFVTICAAPKTSPFTDERLAGEVVTSLNWLRANRGVKIYAYCLMPDHLHILMQLGDPQRPLGEIIAAMKTFTTSRSWKLGYRGALWQTRFYDHLLRSSDDAWSIAEYIRRIQSGRGWWHRRRNTGGRGCPIRCEPGR
jgi:putative transposase